MCVCVSVCVLERWADELYNTYKKLWRCVCLYVCVRDMLMNHACIQNKALEMCVWVCLSVCAHVCLRDIC